MSGFAVDTSDRRPGGAEATDAAPLSGRVLRVLYVWDDEYPWDVRAEKICAGLTAAGHQVHLAARNTERRARQARLPEATVHRLAPCRVPRRLDAASQFPAFFNPRWYRFLSLLTRRIQPDVLVVRDLPLCPTSIRVARRAGVPVILDMAENYPALTRATWDAGRHRIWDYLVRNPAVVRAVERYCVRRVDRVIVVVEESGQRVRALGVNAERITVVSNTPPRARVREPVRQERRGQAAPVELIYLGLLEIPRGVAELIDAVGLLRREGQNVRLTVIGDGRDAELFRDRAAGAGLLGEPVRFLGYLPYDRALELVEGADIGVVPHQAGEFWNTTIPNKLFDYMAAGLPVVSSDAAPAARIVAETGAGEVFRSRDPRSLANAIVRLLDPVARERCAEAGRRAILERFHWEHDLAALRRAMAATVLAAEDARAR